MAAIVGTGLNRAGARNEFFKIFDAANGSAHYNTWATRIQSNKDIERYRWLGSVPPLREWGTGRKARGMVSESYDVENLKYEATIEVDRNEISDDQTGQIMLRIRELARFPLLCSEPRASARADSRRREGIRLAKNRHTITSFALAQRAAEHKDSVLGVHDSFGGAGGG